MGEWGEIRLGRRDPIMDRDQIVDYAELGALQVTEDRPLVAVF